MILNPEHEIWHPEDIQEKLDKLRNFSKDPSREATTSLDELYFNLFKRNTRNMPKGRSLAVKTLRLLLSAFKPLKVDSLVQAVALNAEGHTDGTVNETSISQICSNFIIITESGIVRLAHRSVKEYLVHSHENYVKLEFQSDDESFAEGSTHAQAAETCIAFILSLGYPSWGHVHTDAKTPLSANVTLSGFEVYSCLFWPAHLEKAGKSQKTKRYGSQLMPLLDDGATIASTAFRRWISLLWEYFQSPGCNIEGQTRRQLEDAVSQPPSPFLIACIFGFPEVAQDLLTRRVNFASLNLAKTHNKRGKSALYLAAENGHRETVTLLIRSGADATESHDRWGSIAHAAAWGGDLDAFRLVAERIQKLDDNVLDAALSGGNERLVLDALKRGLDIRLPDTPRKVDRFGIQRSAYPGVKKTSLRLTNSAIIGTDYNKLKFEILLPIDFDIVPARRDPSKASTLAKARVTLLQALELANVRRYEVINCFRRVNGDHKENCLQLYHSGESFEPNGLKEIESRITKDCQDIGHNSQVNFKPYD